MGEILDIGLVENIGGEISVPIISADMTEIGPIWPIFQSWYRPIWPIFFFGFFFFFFCLDSCWAKILNRTLFFVYLFSCLWALYTLLLCCLIYISHLAYYWILIYIYIYVTIFFSRYFTAISPLYPIFHFKVRTDISDTDRINCLGFVCS